MGSLALTGCWFAASGSIAIKDFHDNLIGSISFHFVQEHCFLLLLIHPAFFAHQVSFLIWTHFGEYFVASATQPSSIGLSDAYNVFDS